MSKEMREHINKIKNFGQFLNENNNPSPVTYYPKFNFIQPNVKNCKYIFNSLSLYL